MQFHYFTDKIRRENCYGRNKTYRNTLALVKIQNLQETVPFEGYLLYYIYLLFYIYCVLIFYKHSLFISRVSLYNSNFCKDVNSAT